MKIVSAEQMKCVDRLTAEAGVSGGILMENAALAVVRELGAPSFVRIFCGKGQNAGDGYAAARHVFNRGISVEVVMVAPPEQLTGDALTNYTAAFNMGIKLTPYGELSERRCDVIVDALIGTGLRGEVTGLFRDAVRRINASDAYIVSADLPSGIDADTGEVRGEAVKADKTVTFGFPKLGLFSPLAADYTGEIVVADISIPKNLKYLENINRFLITAEEAALAFPAQSRAAHKGVMGRTLIIGGKPGMAGAVYMAARAAEKAGAGLVTCAVPDELMQPMMCRLTGAMCAPLGDVSPEMIEKAGSVLIGNGMGKSYMTLEFVEKVLKHSKSTVVIDADGLNVLEGRTHILRETDADVVITPHAGEMSRLCGADEIIKRRIDIAERFSGEHNVTVVLKGAYTVVSLPGGTTYINSTGNVGMAKGGSGDVLAGLITGLAAKGTAASSAAVAGVYTHGLAGDMAAERKGVYSLTAEDIIEHIPEAVKNYKNFPDVCMRRSVNVQNITDNQKR